MGEQLALTAPGSGGKEMPVQVLAAGVSQSWITCNYCGRSFLDRHNTGKLWHHHMPESMRPAPDRPWCPRSQGFQARLLARTNDPETSKEAAKEITPDRLGRSLRGFLSMLREHGPLTCKEAAWRFDPYKANYWHVEWCKRVNGWWVKGHIRPTGEVRAGSRVWGLRGGL